MDPSEELKRLALRREFLQAQSDVLRLTLLQQSTHLAPAAVWGERCFLLLHKLKVMLPAVGPLAVVLLFKRSRSIRSLLTRAAVLLSLYRKGRDVATRVWRR